MHLLSKLEQPAPEGRADLHLDAGNAFLIIDSYHLGVFTEFVVHHANQLIAELDGNIHRLAAVHLERLLREAIDAAAQLDGLFTDVFINDLHGIHAVNSIVRGAVVLCAVANHVVVIFVENQRDRLHDIVMTAPAVHLLSVFIQIEVAEDDLLFLLDGILQIIYIIVNGLVAMFPCIGADHIALQNFCAVTAAEVGNLLD